MWGNFSNLQHNFDILCSHGEKPINTNCPFLTFSNENLFLSDCLEDSLTAIIRNFKTKTLVALFHILLLTKFHPRLDDLIDH